MRNNSPLVISPATGQAGISPSDLMAAFAERPLSRSGCFLGLPFSMRLDGRHDPAQAALVLELQQDRQKARIAEHKAASYTQLSLALCDLNRLCRQSHTHFLKQVETFPNGWALFDHCNQFGFEGVVSKRRASGYSRSPSRHWVKVKCPERVNAERHKLFEGPRKPEQTEAQKTLAKNVRSLPGC